MKTQFGHPPRILAAWRDASLRALAAGARTPFYLFSPHPVVERMAGLERLDFGVPSTHWLSCKTQPVPALLCWWRKQGRPVEVVSEFEFLLAREAGFDDILINGPAKHRWLGRVSGLGQRVHFDSLTELRTLLPVAVRQKWRTGLRICTSQEIDPGDPTTPTQFGFDPSEVPEAVRTLRGAGLMPEQVHFHLRTNVAEAGVYAAAANEALAVCAAAGWQPSILDCGGGLPPPYITALDGGRYDARMSLQQYAAELRGVVRRHKHLRGIWLENGRHVLAGSGLLAVRVIDLKERRGVRQAICDGGRTMNALISTWENHALLPLKKGRGVYTETLVYGPTCMAFDRMSTAPLPAALAPGDVLLWFDAGAYHLPWETRFSHGSAEVWWDEDGVVKKIRPAESFESFNKPWI